MKFNKPAWKLIFYQRFIQNMHTCVFSKLLLIFSNIELMYLSNNSPVAVHRGRAFHDLNVV